MPFKEDSYDPAIPANTRERSSGVVISPAPDVPRVPGQAWVEERTRVAVGRSINISGRLVFSEPVRIEGRFKGEVISVDLVVISAEGHVEGRVRAPRLLILGELRGDVTGADKVMLGPRSRLNGRLETANLTVVEGAYLSGDVRMIGISAERQNAPENQLDAIESAGNRP